MLACSIDRSMKFYNLKYRRVCNSVSGAHSETINACMFCYSQPLAVTCSSDRMIKVWDSTTGVNKGKMGCASGAYSMDIAMSDSVAVTGHRDGSLKFWGIRDSKLMHEVKKVHDDLISSVNYMPNDSNMIVTASRDHTVRVVDVRMFKVTQTLENDDYYSTSDTSQIGLSPSGRYAALGSQNGKLIIMDIENQSVEETFGKEHWGNQIVSVDWSKRTSKLATIDNKGMLLIWS